MAVITVFGKVSCVYSFTKGQGEKFTYKTARKSITITKRNAQVDIYPENMPKHARPVGAYAGAMQTAESIARAYLGVETLYA